VIPTVDSQPGRPPPRDEAPSGALRKAIYVLAACVTIAILLVAFSWTLLQDFEQALGPLLLLGLITVIGLAVGLGALIGALVHYGRRHSGVQTLGVVCLALGLLAAGSYTILTTSRYLDPYYRDAVVRQQQSERIGQLWMSRDMYPSCGKVVLQVGEPAREAGRREFRCMRRANGQGTTAELIIVQKGRLSTWYVRTELDRTVEIFIREGALSETDVRGSGYWSYRTCSQDRVQLQNVQDLCVPLRVPVS